MRLFIFILFSVSLGFQSTINSEAQNTIEADRFVVSLEKRIPSDPDTGAFVIVNEIQEWYCKETAIIICDMWDQHWCKGASERVAEMAPFMNNVITTARNRGILIVHAPSQCMDYYKNHPARKLGQKYKSKKAKNLISNNLLDSEKYAVWPVDQKDGGCDDDPQCKQGQPWTKQTVMLEISDRDAISDSGIEIAGLFEARGIRNVILMGVHENMCIIGRSFGLRNMVRLGLNVVLMRDLTDTMYNSTQWPVVSHFTGNSLMTEYIEKYVCPTMLSCDFTGQRQFRFKEDDRPVIAFIIAENEYRANQTLPEFAHELLLTKGVSCEFALGKPVYTGEGIHNIENLKILTDADLAVIQVRRRALPSPGMALLRQYVSSGKPVLGLRTASHAFALNKPLPATGSQASAGKGKDIYSLEQWPEFDRDILGGNYQDHYGALKTGINYSVVPGMESHPLFKGINTDDFTGPVAPLYSLYKNRPLRSPDVQVLLTGKIPDKPDEPVLWINNRRNGKTIYTSMGHWEDWNMEQFRKIMFNAVDYLFNNGN
ncbi:MAG TPA: ThuA domain-containing protein [Bacteroidales bacterium]|nr:ThuA domain-containing protein [Bacteroidales bacterium]HPM86404.1 ThuA domain-containing protein [Bacteroidales bacterium]HQM69025.1 ThuA domain-containing protein [Bacteroidales bacterium]